MNLLTRFGSQDILYADPFLRVLLSSDPHTSTSSSHSHRQLCPFVVSAVVLSLCYLCPCPSPSPPHHPVAVSGAVCHCAGWQDSSRRTLRHPAAVLFAPLSGFLSFCRWHNLYPVLIFLLLITGAPPQCLLRLHSSSPSHVFGHSCDCPSSAVSHAANKLRILSLAQSQGTFSN